MAVLDFTVLNPPINQLINQSINQSPNDLLKMVPCIILDNYWKISSDGSMTTIDKVCIDGPFKLLIRRSIDKLLAENLLYSGRFSSPIVLQTFKLGNVTQSFETRKQNTG